MNHHEEQLGQRVFRSTVVMRADTHQTDYSTWTTNWPVK